jgi:hypothetical protein
LNERITVIYTITPCVIRQTAYALSGVQQSRLASCLGRQGGRRLTQQAYRTQAVLMSGSAVDQQVASRRATAAAPTRSPVGSPRADAKKLRNLEIFWRRRRGLLS